MSDALLAVLRVPAPRSAPALLGATITGRGVVLRISEVEAYHGPTDPGSHGHRGPTARNRSLFGPPGTLYAYRSYGIHTCVNIVSGPDGLSSGSLLRAAEVVDGVAVARERRGASVSGTRLARGPGNLGVALGAVLATDDGSSVVDGSGPYALALDPGLEARLAAVTPAADPAGRGPQDADEELVATVVEELLAERLPSGEPRIGRGPRTGVAGVAGGASFPWRFWLTGDPTVSPYRRHPRATG